MNLFMFGVALNSVGFCKTSNTSAGQPPFCVSVFDKITNILRDKLELLGVEPKAMVAGNINPNGGRKATLFFFCTMATLFI